MQFFFFSFFGELYNSCYADTVIGKGICVISVIQLLEAFFEEKSSMYGRSPEVLKCLLERFLVYEECMLTRYF